MKPIRVSLIAILALVLCACRHRSVPAPVPTVSSPGGYFDLEPGWRLRVITPILQSGKFRLRDVPSGASGNTLTLKTDGEFLGYETAYYSVNKRRGSGVRVSFPTAREMRDGQLTEKAQPLVSLFQMPRGIRHVRLVQLQRSSDRSYDMAVVGARHETALADLTAVVKSAPDEQCVASRERYCAWVPSGIAVRPEKEADHRQPGRMGAGALTRLAKPGGQPGFGVPQDFENCLAVSRGKPVIRLAVHFPNQHIR